MGVDSNTAETVASPNLVASKSQQLREQSAAGPSPEGKTESGVAAADTSTFSSLSDLSDSFFAVTWCVAWAFSARALEASAGEVRTTAVGSSIVARGLLTPSPAYCQRFGRLLAVWYPHEHVGAAGGPVRCACPQKTVKPNVGAASLLHCLLHRLTCVHTCRFTRRMIMTLQLRKWWPRSPPKKVASNKRRLRCRWERLCWAWIQTLPRHIPALEPAILILATCSMLE